MKQSYGYERRPSRGTLVFIEVINAIIDEYFSQGYVLTLRQLYYQLVARDIIPNNLREYKRVGEVLNNGRLGGLVDWDAIEDRTRAFIRRTRWESPKDILRSAAAGFHMDMWSNQPSRVFVIIEKEALAGVFTRICNRYDIPLLAARGYPSISVIKDFADGELFSATMDKDVHLLHFGDHDPSGIDMSRDLIERINMILGHDSYTFTRCALNMDQIQELKPPENPAKTTDSRFESYRKRFGASSWELDALPPEYLNDLVQKRIEPLINKKAWDQRAALIAEHSAAIQQIADAYGERLG